MASVTSSQQALNWVVVGEGAIGLLTACRLQLAGLPVSLWLRQPRPLAIHYQSPTQERTCLFPVAASPLSTVLVAVKAYAVAECLEQLRPYLAPDAQLVISHNGMPNLPALRNGFSAAQGIWFLSTSHGALRTTEGVKHTGFGQSVLSPLNSAAHNAAPLLSANLNTALGPITQVDDIQPALWRKLAVNAAINPLTTLLNCRNGELANPALQPQIRAIVREVCSVAIAEQVPLDANEMQELVQQVITATAENYSSMQQDKQRGRPLELAAITGFIIATAANHNLAVPENTALWLALNQGR